MRKNKDSGTVYNKGQNNTSVYERAYNIISVMLTSSCLNSFQGFEQTLKKP